MSLRLKAVLVALLAFAAPLQARAAEDERWPWYGEWERARFRIKSQKAIIAESEKWRALLDSNQ